MSSPFDDIYLRTFNVDFYQSANFISWIIDGNRSESRGFITMRAPRKGPRKMRNRTCLFGSSCLKAEKLMFAGKRLVTVQSQRSLRHALVAGVAVDSCAAWPRE